MSEIADGSKELRDGVRELQEEADDMIEEYFTFDIDNLTQFLIAEDNPRIDAAAGDVVINRLCRYPGRNYSHGPVYLCDFRICDT